MSRVDARCTVGYVACGIPTVDSAETSRHPDPWRAQRPKGNPRGPTLPSAAAALGLLRPLTPQRPGVAPAVEARARGLVTRSRVEGRGWPDRAVLPFTRRNRCPEVVIPVEDRVVLHIPSDGWMREACHRREAGPGRPRPHVPGATLPVGRRPSTAAVRRLGDFLRAARAQGHLTLPGATLTGAPRRTRPSKHRPPAGT